MIKEKNTNGFSLVELLATIVIISLVLGIGGYYVLNMINNSKIVANKESTNNILRAASLYSEEQPTNLIWNPIDEEQKESFSCISTQELLNKGYLKESDIKEQKYIIITKDNTTKTISNEKIDEEEICKSTMKQIPIPTSKDYCNKNLTYTGKEQTLTKDPEPQYTFSNNIQTNAGDYQITVSLTEETKSENYQWENQTTANQTFTCSIKKATPLLNLTSIGTDSSAIDTLPTTNLTSNVKGTISLKTSNKDHVIATTSDRINQISPNEEKTINIQILATKTTTTFITITLTPEDTKNYYSSSVIYTIGEITKQEVTIPTAEKFCKNPPYNGDIQILTNTAEKGYSFYNNKGKEINDNYEITAKLKYGYIWNDGTLEDKTFTCSIKRPTPIVTYDNNGGEGCNDKKIVTYGSTYGELCTPTRTGYTFNGWYTSPTEGTKITNDTKVENYKNHTIYAHWTANTYTVTYKDGPGCSNDKIVTYGSTYGELCTPAKTGYTFNGWYTIEGTLVNSASKVITPNNHNIYAHWTVNQYTATMNANGGNNGNYPSTWTATYEQSYNIDNYTPTRAGFSFDGWYSDPTYGSKFSGWWTWTATTPYTFYAHWTQTDFSGPTCGTQNPINPAWTNSSRTITVPCSDSDSGIGCTQDSFSQTYTSTTTTASIQIVDWLGNKTDCEVTVNVDTTPPEIYRFKDNCPDCKHSAEVPGTTLYYKDTGGSKVEGLKATAYVTDSSGKKICNRSWTAFDGDAICKNNTSSGKYWWRAYRVRDNAGNRSSIICTYEENGKAVEFNRTNSPTESCTIHGHTFDP